MASKDAIKGYLLEELLAYLVRNTGYSLLVDPSQDREQLEWKGNGLVVRGRGAVHQVDVLGEFSWIPAFTYPIRLFVEAKCRGKRTGIDTVRNAVGVLSDINQFYRPTGIRKIALPRYSYQSAIFSTSGFANPAVNMALAHQISLVDLSGPDFQSLRDLIENLALLVVKDFSPSPPTSVSSQVDPAPRDDRSNGVGSSVVVFLRNHLRTLLGTNPDRQTGRQPGNFDELEKLFRRKNEFGRLLKAWIDENLEFLVGMSNGPNLLVIKPSSLQKFLRYASKHPAHTVTIRYRDIKSGQMTIHPAGDDEAYSLTFGIPTPVMKWILRGGTKADRRAWMAKNTVFQNITIYRRDEGRDQLFRLKFSAKETLEAINRKR